MKYVLVYIGAFVALVFLVLVLAGVFEVAGAKQQAIVNKAALGSRIQATVNDPRNAITNYESFFHDCRIVFYERSACRVA